MSDAANTTPPQDPPNGGLASDQTPSNPIVEGDAQKTVLGGDQPQGGEPKGAEPTPIVLKFPDGVQENKELADSFIKFATDSKMSGEQAQKVFEKHLQDTAALTKSITTKANEAHVARVKGWLSDLKADPEVGGAKFETTVNIANKALEKFGSPQLREFFAKTGAGNHPEVVKLMYRIGQAISEDSVAGTQAGGPTSQSPADAEEQFHRMMYPTMFAGKKE